MVWAAAVAMNASTTPAPIQFDTRIIARPFRVLNVTAPELRDASWTGLLSRGEQRCVIGRMITFSRLEDRRRWRE